jgi:uncharacterized protein (DUF169 family)/NAD-dependent dihydropyrimidine dehydrogenase PreA subunit
MLLFRDLSYERELPMTAEFEFIHDKDRCVACGLCVAFCPQYSLEVGEDGKPVGAHMETCVGCDTCSGQCPKRAITIKRIGNPAEYNPYADEPRAKPISKEEQKRYADAEKLIMDTLDLRWHPVSVGLIDVDEPLPDIPFPTEKLRYCQAMNASRRGASILMPPHCHSCPDGTSIFGMTGVPPKLATGEIYVLFHKVVDAEAAAKMVAERPTLPPHSKRATLTEPLGKTTRHPEVIVFTGNPEQMMWLCMSMSYFDGHRHDFHASGFNAQCVEATLLPYTNDEPNISFGCYGGRASSDIGEDMMYMGVPANRLDTIVEGCRELAKKAIPQSRMKIYVPPIM